ncbi:hypothetical protein [Actinoalloteichus sp. GBA129-24]|uniref:hypothetical protein n=1 Tax=Actinoalloteichus sp. GBA129-24 TaxID=1612551 RepID=UPI0009505D6A|nr:hypothetical protein [Actinoalloteichus sp. GBA129-24]APU19330.1 hypothetical protein UA75_06535 [Actinoalloteichus sp. GBA129-24]
MSVTDVVARLRQAHALLTEARHATTQADAAITDGATLFANATAGSTQPEVGHINHLATASSEDVRTAHALLLGAQEVIDAYCHDIAGHGIGDSSTDIAQSSSSSAPKITEPENRYTDWIAELRRSGTKVSPDRIVWMIRHQDGHLVWLEVGTDRSGLRHVLTTTRIGNFSDQGVPVSRIPTLLREGIEHGQLVGYQRDREVYEIDIDGTRMRFAVLIGSNGYIITAHPIKLSDKIQNQRRKK